MRQREDALEGFNIIKERNDFIKDTKLKIEILAVIKLTSAPNLIQFCAYDAPQSE